jgi:hypothetical protein
MLSQSISVWYDYTLATVEMTVSFSWWRLTRNGYCDMVTGVLFGLYSHNTYNFTFISLILVKLYTTVGYRTT